MRGLPLPERCIEARLVVSPPASAPVESLGPAHFLPHFHEAWLAGLDPASHELATLLDRTIEYRHKVDAGAGVEAVCIGYQAQAAGPVLFRPSQPARVDVVVDGDAHPRERRDVEDPTPGGSEIEIEKRDGTPVAEHDVSR